MECIMTNACQIWMMVIVLVTILRSTSLQFMPMQMMPMPPLLPPIFMPPPMMMGAFAFRIPNNGTEERTTKITTTTTTARPTTTETNIAIVMPMPVPLPGQFGFPAPPGPLFCQAKPRPPNCPPCPPCVCAPSCTPAFFSYCSSCHQKCRCKQNQGPIPLPPIPFPGPAYPIPFPGPPAPVIVVPYPPARPSSSSEGGSTKEQSDESDSCSEESNAQHNKYKNKGKIRQRNRKRLLHIQERNMPSESDDDNYVKPVLSFVSSNDDVMIKKAISDNDANRQMGQRHKVRVINRQGKELVVSSNGGYGTELTQKNNMMSLMRGGQKAMLGTGKKELVFKPPHNKKISNLSVTFHID